MFDLNYFVATAECEKEVIGFMRGYFRRAYWEAIDVEILQGGEFCNSTHHQKASLPEIFAASFK